MSIARLGSREAETVDLSPRNAKDLSARFPDTTAALKGPPDESVVDGEVVATDAAGRPSFSDLQNYQTSRASLFYYLLDLLTYRGKDLRQRPLKERRAMLETKIMSRVSDPAFRDPCRESAQADRNGSFERGWTV